MFYNQLRNSFYEHANVYRAVTVDEYRSGCVNLCHIEAEFHKIGDHWNKACAQIDMKAMAYPVELFDFVDSFLFRFGLSSEWGLPIAESEPKTSTKATSS